MWNRFVVWLTNYSLSKSDLSLEQRNNIIKHILGSLQTLPISGIITTNTDGEILISGRSLDIEKAVELREAAKVVLSNKAFKLVNREVLYVAVVGGLHKSKSDIDLYFYKAAIWFGQQFEIQLRILAQQAEESDY